MPYMDGMGTCAFFWNHQKLPQLRFFANLPWVSPAWNGQTEKLTWTVGELQQCIFILEELEVIMVTKKKNLPETKFTPEKW